MDYFLSKIRNDIFDLFSGAKKCFDDLSMEAKFDLIKSYMLMKEYSFLEVVENLIFPKFEIENFKRINKICEDLPDDSDSEIDLMFISYICSYHKLSAEVDIKFNDAFIESVEDFVNEIFDFYSHAKNEPYYYGYGYKEINQ